MKTKRRSSIPTRTFKYSDPEAESVSIAGSFNDWDPTAAPLMPAGPGKWKISLKLPPGRHEYLYVVDGRWLPDPAATECCPNPYGGTNSVIST